MTVSELEGQLILAEEMIKVLMERPCLDEHERALADLALKKLSDLDVSNAELDAISNLRAKLGPRKGGR